MRSLSWAIFKTFLSGRSTKGFIAGTVVSFAFSIAVILGTFGIMDGFDYALKRGLRNATGDMIFYGQDGFFQVTTQIKDIFDYHGITEWVPYIQTEGFLVSEENERGILIKGIEAGKWAQVTGMSLPVKDNQVVVGQVLFQDLGLRTGDEIVLAFANGNGGPSFLPLLHRFKVVSQVNHGIYLKDSRYVYIDRSYLQKLLGFDERVNLVAVNVPQKIGEDIDPGSDQYIDRVDEYTKLLQSELGYNFDVRPFWKEFNTLIEAVRVQKFSIGLILQIIVVVAIFNVLAFLIFLNEKKSQGLFLIQALGTDRKRIMRLWAGLTIAIWALSCALSFLLVKFFGFLLTYFSAFHLPGDVYNLTELRLKLSASSYMIVFGLAFVWVVLMTFVTLRRHRNQSIISLLRKEFV